MKMLHEGDGDCISRAEAIWIADRAPMYYDGWAIEELTKLPRINPRRAGHWIVSKNEYGKWMQCNVCNSAEVYNPGKAYCPYCGARLGDPNEED